METSGWWCSGQAGDGRDGNAEEGGGAVGNDTVVTGNVAEGSEVTVVRVAGATVEAGEKGADALEIAAVTTWERTGAAAVNGEVVAENAAWGRGLAEAESIGNGSGAGVAAIGKEGEGNTAAEDDVVATLERA